MFFAAPDDDSGVCAGDVGVVGGGAGIGLGVSVCDDIGIGEGVVDSAGSEAGEQEPASRGNNISPLSKIGGYIFSSLLSPIAFPFILF